MENHSTESKYKKNGGQTKRSSPASKSYQGPLLRRGKYAAGPDSLWDAGLDLYWPSLTGPKTQCARKYLVHWRVKIIWNVETICFVWKSRWKANSWGRRPSNQFGGRDQSSTAVTQRPWFWPLTRHSVWVHLTQTSKKVNLHKYPDEKTKSESICWGGLEQDLWVLKCGHRDTWGQHTARSYRNGRGRFHPNKTSMVTDRGHVFFLLGRLHANCTTPPPCACTRVLGHRGISLKKPARASAIPNHWRKYECGPSWAGSKIIQKRQTGESVFSHLWGHTWCPLTFELWDSKHSSCRNKKIAREDKPNRWQKSFKSTLMHWGRDVVTRWEGRVNTINITLRGFGHLICVCFKRSHYRCHFFLFFSVFSLASNVKSSLPTPTAPSVHVLDFLLLPENPQEFRSAASFNTSKWRAVHPRLCRVTRLYQ